MTPDQIRAALMAKGYSMAKLSRELGFKSASSVRDFIIGRKGSKTVAAKINEITGLDLPPSLVLYQRQRAQTNL